MAYQELSAALQAQIQSDREAGRTFPFRTEDASALRRRPGHHASDLWRPAYIKDAEKIMNSAYYNRYADKTQVFSFYQNDDLSRRALHVQLVSRIARNIGRMLGLNLDLIEAIALGHDIGHTPFGHAGERYLSALYHEQTGRLFHHNVHSVRVLDRIVPYNISLQTLDGILCHNGELEQDEYRPVPLGGFDGLEHRMEECSADAGAVGRLVPGTLEGCVVRVSDIIAYIGKDRQDAARTNLIADDTFRNNAVIGEHNAEIINNLTVNLVENSYGKGFLRLDAAYFEELRRSKQENYSHIYTNAAVAHKYETIIEPMFRAVYGTLLDDLRQKRRDSVVYRHHIDFINEKRKFYPDGGRYEDTEENQIVVDYVASMTDDYFLELHAYLFPDSPLHVEYVSYFDAQSRQIENGEVTGADRWHNQTDSGIH